MQRRLIIAAVLAFVLLSCLITDQTPAWVESIFGVAFFVAVVGSIAFSIISGTGWRALASTYPERIPYTGQWRYCRTFQMLALHSNQPFGTRFSGSIVAVGTTSSALYISLPPILRLLFPNIQLPWAAIVSAKPFEAPGWVTPIATPGAIFQAQYDPGFRGEFVELETKEPKVQIRLSMHALEEARSHLPLIPA